MATAMMTSMAMAARVMATVTKRANLARAMVKATNGNGSKRDSKDNIDERTKAAR